MTGLGCVLYYDPASGEVAGVIDYQLAVDDDGNTTGIIDFEQMELDDLAPADFGMGVSRSGDPTVFESGFWPEWIGGQAQHFVVEWQPPAAGKRRPRITALRHRVSGHRRVRAQIEAARQARWDATPKGQAVDMRDLIGTPTRPLVLDDTGRTKARPVTPPSTPRPPLLQPHGRA